MIAQRTQVGHAGNTHECAILKVMAVAVEVTAVAVEVTAVAVMMTVVMGDR